jgi:hypothetical protein
MNVLYTGNIDGNKIVLVGSVQHTELKRDRFFLYSKYFLRVSIEKFMLMMEKPKNPNFEILH